MEEKTQDPSATPTEEEGQGEDPKGETPKEEENLDYWKNKVQELEKESQKSDKAWADMRRKAEEADELRTKLKEYEDNPSAGSVDKEEISKLLDEKLAILKRDLSGDIQAQKVDMEISKHTADPYKQKVIKSILQNRIVPTGNYEKDVADAVAIVDGEMQRSKVSKDTKGSGSGAGKKETTPSMPNLSDADKRRIAQMGFKWNEKTQMFEDPKSRVALKWNKETGMLENVIRAELSA